MEGNYYPLIKWILLPPLAGAALNLFARRRLRAAGAAAACLAALVSFGFSALALSDLLNLPPENRLLRDTLFNWFSAGGFSADAAFRFDPLSAAMALIVSGVGFLIHLYSAAYMKDDPGYGRYFSYLNLFLFFMLALVLADNPLVMFAGWEGVGLASYLLIGFWYADPEKAAAGKKAFITNRVGDAGLLGGLMLMSALLAAQGAPALDFSSLAANAHLLAGHTVLGMAAPTLICLLLFWGAAGKSAQFPLHVWLPDAMAGPTPVSALIHAATMVTAGVYLLARLSFLFAMAPRALEVVLLAGAFTAFAAAIAASVQKDIKKVLAYSTISQLGYMFMAAGAGAFSASVFHLATHSFFKALLFLGAGSLIHALGGEQDLFKMGGLAKKLPVTFALMCAGWLAVAGFPGLSGFYSKDLILEGVLEHGGAAALAAGLLTAALTAFYTTRLISLAFLRPGPAGGKPAHEAPVLMLAPMAVLALLSLLGGSLLKDSLPAFLGAGAHAGAAWLPWASALACACGIGAGILFTAPKPANFLKNTLAPLHALAAAGFRADGLYAALLIRPLRRLAGAVAHYADAWLIDGLLVGGTGRLACGAGRLLASAQNGRLDIYALIFAAGAALLVYLVI